MVELLGKHVAQHLRLYLETKEIRVRMFHITVQKCLLLKKLVIYGTKTRSDWCLLELSSSFDTLKLDCTILLLRLHDIGIKQSCQRTIIFFRDIGHDFSGHCE